MRLVFWFRTVCRSLLLPHATGRVPFAPATDRTDVDVIDLRFPRVPFSEGPEEALVVVEKHRIVVIRKDVPP
jgi:hypothetical protein